MAALSPDRDPTDKWSRQLQAKSIVPAGKRVPDGFETCMTGQAPVKYHGQRPSLFARPGQLRRGAEKVTEDVPTSAFLRPKNRVQGLRAVSAGKGPLAHLELKGVSPEVPPELPNEEEEALLHRFSKSDLTAYSRATNEGVAELVDSLLSGQTWNPVASSLMGTVEPESRPSKVSGQTLHHIKNQGRTVEMEFALIQPLNVEAPEGTTGTAGSLTARPTTRGGASARRPPTASSRPDTVASSRRPMTARGSNPEETHAAASDLARKRLSELAAKSAGAEQRGDWDAAVKALYESVNLLQDSKQRKTAITYAQRMQKAATKLGDSFVLEVSENLLGICRFNVFRLQEAWDERSTEEDSGMTALERHVDLAREPESRFVAHTNAGIVAHHLKLEEKALEHFGAALDVATHELDDPLTQALVLDHLALSEVIAGRRERAFEHLTTLIRLPGIEVEKSIEVHLQLSELIVMGVQPPLEEDGEISGGAAQAAIVRAASHVKHATEESQATCSESIEVMSAIQAAWQHLGQIAIEHRFLEEANDFLGRSLAFARDIGDPNMISEAKCALGIARGIAVLSGK